MCRPPLPSEIYDLAWSPCGSFILTGSMDNVARIYRASDGTCVRQIAEHVHYVQGVAWDPRGEWVATQGSDRSVHVYSVVQQHEGKEKERGRTLEVGGGMKSSRMEVPGHLLPTTRPHLEHQTSNTSPIPAASPPGTPGLLCLNLGPGAVPTRMDPPLATPVSHSRRGSFSSMTSSSRRSVSPSPTSGLVLPAVANTRPGSSPKLGPTSSSSLPPLPAETGAAGAGIGVGAGMGVGVKGAKTMSLYANEQLLSFFRRLSWAPDGSLLFAPAGVWNPRLESSSHANPASGSGSGSATSVNASEEKKEVNTVYIYSRAGLGKPPVAHLPGQRKPAVAVRCSPIYYKLRPLDDSALEDDKADVVREGKPVFALPYRIIYAVATQDSVVIYDTQHPTPIAVASNLHYAGFTDLAWSGDGRWLVAVSGDGYASILVFEEGELGEVHPGPEGQGRRHRGSDAGERGRSGMSGMRVPVPPSPSRTSSSSSMVAGVPVSVSVPSGPPALASISSGTPPVTPAPVSGVVEKKEEGKEDGEAKEPEKKKRRVVPTLVSGLDGAPGPSGS
ncbi:Chromatin assembly factor 1 subunit [Saitoella coloradoensis]